MLFSVLVLVFPQGFINATPAEDKALADFVRSLGITNSVIPGYSNNGQKLLQATPGVGQVLGVSSEILPNLDPLPTTEVDPNAFSIPGICNGIEACNTYCNTVNTPIAVAQCANLSSQYAGAYGLSPDIQAGIANPNLDTDPVAQANLGNSITNSSNQILQEANDAAAHPVLPAADPAKTLQETNCINSYLQQLIASISNSGSQVNPNGVDQCFAESQVLGMSTDLAPNVPGQEYKINLPKSLLIKTADSKTVYFVNNVGLKLPMFNDKVFYSYGNKLADIKTISQTELDSYVTAQYISYEGDLYQIDLGQGVKHHLQPAAKIRLNVQAYSIMSVNKTELDSYKNGENIE